MPLKQENTFEKTEYHVESSNFHSFTISWTRVHIRPPIEKTFTLLATLRNNEKEFLYQYKNYVPKIVDWKC